MKAIIAEKLTKIYSDGKKALESASFQLDQGEVFGFLGPNGAGYHLNCHTFAHAQ